MHLLAISRLRSLETNRPSMSDSCGRPGLQRAKCGTSPMGPPVRPAPWHVLPGRVSHVSWPWSAAFKRRSFYLGAFLGDKPEEEKAPEQAKICVCADVQ